MRKGKTMIAERTVTVIPPNPVLLQELRNKPNKLRVAAYSMCVPNGVVRKDQNGHFVLVVREVKGILGAQTVAERVNISVLERDRNRCAIEGPLNREYLIIVSGNRPVSEGNRVRVE